MHFNFALLSWVAVANIIAIRRLTIFDVSMKKSCHRINRLVFKTTEKKLSDEYAFAAKAKALAHPARLRILKILYLLDKSGGCLNSGLVSELGLAQSTVSEHLRILRQTGFITVEPIPPKMCYRIQRAALKDFKNLFDELFQK